MNRLLLCFLLFCAGCQLSEKPAGILNPSSLQTDTLLIRTDRDTVLTTSKGARLHIPKGAFSGSSGQEALLVKEAYSFEDIVRAGLQTRSGDKALSSGGMIYVAAVKNGVSLQKPIGVELPAQRFDASMQLYRGSEQEGRIDWTNPEPLRGGDTLKGEAVSGKKIFEAQCRTCHAVDRNLTGPALAYFTERGPWNDSLALHKFYSNPAAFIAHNEYARCLQQQYGAIMPAYELNSDEVNALTAFISSETERLALPRPKDLDCADSCRRYEAALWTLDSLVGRREELARTNELRTEFQRTMPRSLETSIPAERAPGPSLEIVASERLVGEYYRFEISSFGWYNVDKLINEAGAVESYLSVTVNAAETDEWNVFIAIPKYKIFYEGGKLKDQNKLYGFHTTDGKLPLPQGIPVTVFVLSEAGGKVYFDMQTFGSTMDNRIELHPKPYAKADVDRLIAGLQLEDISVKIADSKNATDIRAVDKQLESQRTNAERWRPVNCPCNCAQPASDTAAMPVTYSAGVMSRVADSIPDTIMR
jgi:mono/diheme cytochrome c family protein